MAEPTYVTREQVKNALDSKLTARDDAQVDRAREAGSRSLEELLHRRFYPEVATRYFDWPNQQYARTWRLWLDGNELISITSLVAGGVTVASADRFLRRSDDRDEAPYTHIEVDLDSSAAFSAAGTHQRQIVITGLFGYRDDEAAAGALVEALDASETGVDVNGAAAAAIGVGSIIRCDDERMVVTGRTWLDSGQNLGGSGLTASASDVTAAVATGSAYTAGEVILIDSERLLVVDVAGNNLTVKRAWDGSVLAAHAAGVDIYGSRTLTVERAALGTTAAAHSDATALAVWRAPSMIRDLAVAEAIAQIEQEQSGYGRTVGGGESEREARGVGLEDLRRRARIRYGRKARTAAI